MSDDVDLDHLRFEGMDVMDMRLLQQGLSTGKQLRHKFLVLDNRERTVDWEWLTRHVDSLPIRILIVDAGSSPPSGDLEKKVVYVSPEEAEVALKTPGDVMKFFWEKWVQNWWAKYGICLRIDPLSPDEERWVKRIGDEVVSQGSDRAFTEGNRMAVFDHYTGPERQDMTKLYGSAVYHSDLERGGSTYNFLAQSDKHAVKEAALVSVAVLDERVALERDRAATVDTGRYSDGGQNLAKVWEKRRVYLIDPNPILRGEKQFLDFVETITTPLTESIFDFLVIHQGVIDAARQTGDFDHAWSQLKKKARWIVIDTGRGRPDQAIRERLRWVEYSSLAGCIVEKAGDKIRLAQLLFSLRADTSIDGAVET